MHHQVTRPNADKKIDRIVNRRGTVGGSQSVLLRAVVSLQIKFASIWGVSFGLAVRDGRG